MRYRVWLCRAVFRLAERCPRWPQLLDLAIMITPTPPQARERIVAWQRHLRSIPPRQALAEIAEVRRQWEVYQAQKMLAER